VSIGPYELRFDLFGTPQQSDSGSADPSTSNEALLDAYRRLHQFSRRLAETEHVEDLLERLLDDVIELIQAERGFICLVEGDRIEKLTARNIQSPDVHDLESDAWSDTIVQEVIKKRQPVIISDAMNDNLYKDSRSVLNMRLTSVLCVPMIHQDELLGVLYVGNNNIVNLFTEQTLSIATVFAAQAALVIHVAIALNNLRGERDQLQEQLDQVRFGEIIGSSDCMLQVFRTIERIADTDLPCLIMGETGTGKELVARELHRRSHREKRTFVAVNCGAIPENLLESELFGHVRGAFSGAVANHVGLFERAHQGTLFLDEIGELPARLQVKLLRAIQEGVVRPVGAERDVPVQVRILSATNQNLDEAIKSGSFREDLLYRLNTVEIELPPLRDRGSDTILIANALLKLHGPRLNPRVRGFQAAAVRAMSHFAWPGNVRQLENRIKKALVMAEDLNISPKDLALEESSTPSILPLGQAKEQFVRDYIKRALQVYEGNRARTAQILEVDPRTIYRYLESDRSEGE